MTDQSYNYYIIFSLQYSRKHLCPLSLAAVIPIVIILFFFSLVTSSVLFFLLLCHLPPPPSTILMMAISTLTPPGGVLPALFLLFAPAALAHGGHENVPEGSATSDDPIVRVVLSLV